MHNTRFKLKIYFVILLFAASFSKLSAQLYINEIMASNSTSLADEMGEYDDWIEIYNAGNQSVNLAGYYMTDTPNDNASFWQIPSNNAALTTVAAGGYLILWADKSPEQGAHHLDFKLSAGGESIALLSSTLDVIDSFDFTEQNENVSYGRVTDGNSDFIIFFVPTPGGANDSSLAPTFNVQVMTSIDDGFDDAEENTEGLVNLYSHELQLGLDDGESQTVGLRFNNINIPADATIVNAYIQFMSYWDVSSGPADLTIWGEASSNAAPLENNSFNLTSRTQTTSTVQWTPENWGDTYNTGQAQRSNDIAPLLSEILNIDNWNTGNSVAFFIEGTGTRVGFSYDAPEPAEPAMLVVTYEMPISEEPVADLFINEIMPRGDTSYLDENGKDEDWIELYNGGSTPAFLGGLFLSDDPDHLTKWQIEVAEELAPGDFITVWADDDDEEGGLHTNFLLNSDGETLVLSQLIDGQPVIIDEVTYGEIPFSASYGRLPNGTDNLVLLGEQSPAASNDDALLYLTPPLFSIESGIFSSAQSLTLSHLDSDVLIYYSTDGSLPDDSFTQYTGPITLSESTVIRAVAVKTGYANSQSSNENYIIGDGLNIPVLHVTTDPDNLYDDEIGIYVVGTNGTTGQNCAPEYPVNYAQDWERPANLKLIMEDGTKAFDVNAGIRVAGACSRNNPLKSLNIYLRANEYGNAAINYPLFDEREHSDYRRLKLRSSGQDAVRMGFRDAINMEMLSDQVDVDFQANLPVMVFMNGEFFALMHLRENYRPEYFEAIYDVDKDDIDIIKSPGLPHADIKNGNDLAYGEFLDFVQSTDLSSETNYQNFTDQVDVNEFINYWIAMPYMGNYDWPGNNLGVWRERKDSGKWRYLMQDTDGSTGSGLSGFSDYDYNTFEIIMVDNSNTWPNHSLSTLALRKALENENFFAEYVQRTCSFIHLIYNQERVTNAADSRMNLFEPHAQTHIDRWIDIDPTFNPYGGNLFSWTAWIDNYKTFYEMRPEYYRTFLNDALDMNGTFTLNVNFDENSGGTVNIHDNEMNLPFNYEGTYFKNIPIRFEAVANPGYEFSHWLETSITENVIYFTTGGNTTMTPIFTNLCPDGSVDTDNDGYCDAIDNCPNNFNPEQEDENENGIGDVCEDCPDDIAGTACDDNNECTINDTFNSDCECIGLELPDSDVDGICDAIDNCPNDGNPDQADDDNDGIGNTCDDCNGNLAGTACDDGDACTENDTFDENCNCLGSSLPDIDEDGTCDTQDNCPVNSNPDQADDDNDGIGNICDDCDNSLIGTICDDNNNCTVNDLIDENCNCIGTALPDADDDGVCDEQDNCPDTPNSNQLDFDSDGIGDACDECDETIIGTLCDDGDVCTTDDVYDSNCNCSGNLAPDSDNDGTCDEADNCPNEANPNQEDADEDGIGDICDDCDNNIIGTACDDGDNCTSGDVYDAECNCVGTLIDADNDMVCANEDCDDNNPNIPTEPGTPCDDGNAATAMDMIAEDGCTCEGTTAVEELTTPTVILLFPNPVTDLLRVQVSPQLDEDSSITIYDSLGRTVYFSAGNRGEYISFDTRNFTQGLYYLLIKNEKVNEVRSFVKH